MAVLIRDQRIVLGAYKEKHDQPARRYSAIGDIAHVLIEVGAGFGKPY
jgi:hypothetical protein